jgi:hypothetical protein
MNTSIYAFAISILFAGTFLTSCQSAVDKADKAQIEAQEAQQALKEADEEAKLEAQKALNAEEWRVFKSDMEMQIVKNENRIAELKVQLKKPGKVLDKVYEKRIDALEQQNKDLSIRINAYEKNQSDWASFKREFNHDIDELGKALNDLTVNNKN